MARHRQPPRRFLFVSYASADIVLAEWLGERLILEGYEVWLDRWCLPAGSDWSREIGRVMAEDNFRVIHLLSQYSMHDSYAAPERGRACDLGRERGEAFLIPLLLQPMKRTERPIELQNLVAIDFEDWGEGLDRLLRELKSIDAPRREVAVPKPRNPTGWTEIVAEGTETLFSNAFAVEDIPTAIHHYRSHALTDASKRDRLRLAWPHWQPYGTGDVLSFHKQPADLPAGIRLAHQRSVVWRGEREIADQPVSTVLPVLLRRTFEHRCHTLGLIYWKQSTRTGSRERSTNWLYFPAGLVPGDKLKVNNWSGHSVSIKLIGERTYKGEPFLAHLAFSPFLEQIESGAFLLYLRLGVRPVQMDGTLFESAKVGPRVKQVTRGWTNADLLSRLRVVSGFLADETGEIRCGPAEQPQIRLTQICGCIPWRLDEPVLNRLGAEPASGEIDSDPEES